MKISNLIALLAFALLSNTYTIAQGTIVNIIFEEGNNVIRNIIPKTDDSNRIEMFLFKKKKCDCKNDSYYNYFFKDGKLQKGIIGTTNYPSPPQLSLLYQEDRHKVKRVQKSKIKENIIFSTDIVFSVWKSFEDVLREASKIYILTEDPENKKYYISYEVSLKYKNL